MPLFTLCWPLEMFVALFTPSLAAVVGLWFPTCSNWMVATAFRVSAVWPDWSWRSKVISTSDGMKPGGSGTHRWCGPRVFCTTDMWPFSSTSSSDPFLKGTTADKDCGDRREIESVLRKRFNTPSRLRDWLLSPPPPANVGESSLFTPRWLLPTEFSANSKKSFGCLETNLFALALFILQEQNGVLHIWEIYIQWR